ncbi:MAG TPA: S41 family peptidase [Anaerolineales bacterium]|nr:S41 family peptidase [Anaerolineales bacterium]
MKRILFILLITGLALSACGVKEIATAPPLPTLSPVDRQTRVLDALHIAIGEQYIYTDFGGVNWENLRTETQDKIKGGLTHAEFEEAMSALVDTLPGESVVYQTRAERIEIELENTALYSGIGAYITVRTEPQPHIIIMAIIEGSPAESAGLKPHDSIYSVDGEPVTAEEGLDVVQRVRGEAGTPVELEVESPDGLRRTVKVTRSKLTAADSLQAFMLSNSGIAYLRLPVNPTPTFLQELGGVMQSVAERNVRGIILDMRVARSGGGWPLSEMLTLFGNGRLGEFYSRADTTPVEVQGVNVGGSQDLPLVILVGPDTEGSPEIFAAALQESGRAAVVGLPTSGNIFGYETVPLPDGSRLTLAISSYKTESGRDLGENGVEPDVIIESDWDEVSEADDPPLRKAIEIILRQ